MKQDLSVLLKSRGLRMSELAKRIGVDKSTVTRWAQKQIPVERVPDVAAATGIPAELLRPDLASIFRTQAAA